MNYMHTQDEYRNLSVERLAPETVVGHDRAPAKAGGTAAIGALLIAVIMGYGTRDGRYCAELISHSSGPDSPASHVERRSAQPFATVNPVDPAMIRDRLLKQLGRLDTASDDRATAGTTQPCARAFADARAFVKRLPVESIPTPDIGLADDGEVNFLWISDNVYIDLGFYGTGSYSCFARDSNGREILRDDLPADGGLPDDIADIFSSHSIIANAAAP